MTHEADTKHFVRCQGCRARSEAGVPGTITDLPVGWYLIEGEIKITSRFDEKLPREEEIIGGAGLRLHACSPRCLEMILKPQHIIGGQPK